MEISSNERHEKRYAVRLPLIEIKVGLSQEFETKDLKKYYQE